MESEPIMMTANALGLEGRMRRERQQLREDCGKKDLTGLGVGKGVETTVKRDE